MEKSIQQTGVKYGLYLGSFLLIYGLIFRVAKIPHTSPLGLIFYISLPIFIYLSIRFYKKNYPVLTFKKGMIISAIISFIGSVVYSVFTFFYNKFIDDSLLKNVLEENTEKVSNNTTLTQEQIDQSLKLVEILTQPGAFSITIFIQLFAFGIITSLLIIWLMNRKNK